MGTTSAKNLVGRILNQYLEGWVLTRYVGLKSDLQSDLHSDLQI